MKTIFVFFMMVFLIIGLAVEATPHGKHYKEEKLALKVHQKAETQRLKERQKTEKEHVIMGGGNLKLLLQHQKEARQKLKARQKAENEQIKND